MSLARYNLYTGKKGKPLRTMALPPTEANMLLHMKRVHMQVTLWKAADRQGPPILDSTKFGWDMKSGLPSPSLDTGPAAPDGPIDIISSGFQRLLLYVHPRTHTRTYIHYIYINSHYGILSDITIILDDGNMCRHHFDDKYHAQFPDIEEIRFFDNGGPHLQCIYYIHIILQHFK